MIELKEMEDSQVEVDVEAGEMRPERGETRPKTVTCITPPPPYSSCDSTRLLQRSKSFQVVDNG